MRKDAKRERKKKHGSRKGVVSYMLHEPSMVRPCMEGYLCVGGPTSSEERRLVGDPVGNARGVKGGALMTKCRSGFSSTELGNFVS